jgi:hypothetical protein
MDMDRDSGEEKVVGATCVLVANEKADSLGREAVAYRVTLSYDIDSMRDHTNY